MGMLEELMMRLGVSSPDYGQTGMDLSPEERKRLIEERMLGYKSDVGGMDLSPQLTPWGESLFGSDQDADSGSIADRTAPKDQAVKALMDARRSDQEDEETKRMQDDAMQRSLDPMSWVQQTDASPLSPEEKLKKIAAEARAMGGGGGLSAGGGTVSRGANTPELQARLAERDEWAGGQTERNLEFATTPEQARRNPEYAASAADKLAGLQKSGAVEQQVANQRLLIDEYAKQGGGKIPFEMANKFDVAGFDVPWPMRGKSPDQVKENINATVIAAEKDIQDVMTSPQERQYLEWIKALAPQYQAMIDAGMDPDQAWERFDSLVKGGAQESGAIQAYMQRAQAAQQPQE